MMDEIITRFNDVADEYETFTDKIPNYSYMVSVIREIFEIWDSERSPQRICELGTGNGQMAYYLVTHFKPEIYRGIDGSRKMIENSRERFDSYTGDATVSFENVLFENWTPANGYDWIFSSLSIHHLEDPKKRVLFRKIFQILEAGGRFLLCDLVQRPPELMDFYKKIRKRRMVKNGLTEEEFQERWQIHVQNDVPATLSDVLSWLREIGFKNVDCPWKDMNRSIVIGMKPDN